MDGVDFLVCWTPVLLLAALAVVGKRPALELSLYGVGGTALLAATYFRTPLSVVSWAALDGIVTTIPLLLVIQAGILLSNLLVEAGAINRIVEWFRGGVRDSRHRHVLITLGTANFFEGASVIAEPLVAPMLRASGVSPPGAAALSIVGYAGLMTIEMTGIIITVLALVTGLPEAGLGAAAAWLSVPATLAMVICMPWFLPGGWGDNARRLPFLLASGLLVSLAALATALHLSLPVSGMVGGLALMMALLAGGRWRATFHRALARDLLPFAVVFTALLLVNIVPGLRELTAQRWVFSLQVVPVHTITFQPLYSAYVYLFAAFGLAVAVLQVDRETVRRVWSAGLRQGRRALTAMALFGAMGQIIAYSGYAEGFSRLTPTANIPWLLAQGLKTYTGDWYPLFVPFLGWVGTFLTGYGVASLMLFGELQVRAAEFLQVSATWLAAGLAVGASLGSISSPFKIAIATPMCGAVGQEGRILRLTIPLGVAASLFLGLLLKVVL